jgi:TPR repeat protein
MGILFLSLPLSYAKAAEPICEKLAPDVCHKAILIEIKKGEALIQQSMQDLRANCEKGSAKSCFLVASMLTKRQEDGAQDFFRKACEKGELAGCNSIGIISGATKDKNEVIRILEKACQGGVAKSCLSLANTYIQVGSHEKADKIFNTLCNAQDTSGCVSYGQYQKNIGKADRALAIFRTACQSGRRITCLWIQAMEVKTGLK